MSDGLTKHQRYYRSEKGQARNARWVGSEKKRAYDRSRRRLDLLSIRRTNQTIARYEDQLTRPPHQEAT